MPRPLDKTQLLTQAAAGYETLESLLNTLTPEAMTAPGLMGDRSVKDVLAHLVAWQQMFLRWYETGLRGETPAVPAEGFNWSQLPALNQALHEATRHRPLADVMADFRSSHARTVALAEALSDEALTAPGPYPWMNRNTLIAYLTSVTSSHYAWARTGLRAGLRRARPTGPA